MAADPPSDHPREAPHPPPFPTGRLLAGRYELIEPIGEGATARVFRARDHRLDRIVAIKVLRPQHGQDPEARARFGVEARTAARLNIANVVPVYDLGIADDGSLFIVMRYIDGPSLRQVLAARGALDMPQAVEIGRQVAQALGAAHDHGLVHRDVKPGNILLDLDGAAHLADFGVVKALAGDANLTRTGMTFGTAAYVAPEQATGQAVGPRSDLYALGVVLYEALAGRPPFTGDDPIAVSYQHVHALPQRLSAVRPEVDGLLDGLVMRCLEKDPALRPSDAQEVARTLESIGQRLGSAGGAASIGVLAAAGPADAPTLASHGLQADDTVWMPVIAAAPATARLERQPAGSATAAAGTAAVAGGGPAPLELGLAPRGRRAIGTRRVRAARRGGQTALVGTLILLVAAVLVGAVLAWPGRGPGDDRAAVAEPSPTQPALTTPIPTRAALQLLPTAPPALPTAAPTQAATAQWSPALEPTPLAIPEPTSRPTP
ncbi:MAG TPA: protein kinase, partial [Candidatus Limnocylindrales bacterium]|nr:protein kinase [Candidatus Limnocylindrales bacterium]